MPLQFFARCSVLSEQGGKVQVRNLFPVERPGGCILIEVLRTGHDRGQRILQAVIHSVTISALTGMGIYMKKILLGILIGLLISVCVVAIWHTLERTAVVSEELDDAPAVVDNIVEVASVPPAVSRAADMFEQAVTSATVPGISVAIAGTDGVIWAKGFGWADVENKVPMSTQTKMRIGSVAKPFTTAALMRLYDQGMIDLDVDVRSYVPAWPEKHAAITLRQLTSHTSGIRHYDGDEFMSNVNYPTVAGSLDIFKESPLKFEPGSEQSYSTYAWTLVSAATEGADGGRDFKEIMQQEVFGPLEMNDSAFDQQYEIIPNRQRPYSIYEGEMINSPQTDHSYKWAGGGFIASTSDVARFAVAHTGADFLKEETLTEMFTKATMTDGNQSQFGIGWQIGFDRYLERFSEDQEALRIMGEHANAVMHSGGSAGGTTMMILCRDHKRGVAVVKNVDRDNSVSHFLLALKTLDIFHQK